MVSAVTYIKGGLKSIHLLGKGILKPLQCTCTAHAALAPHTSHLTHTSRAPIFAGTEEQQRVKQVKKIIKV